MIPFLDILFPPQCAGCRRAGTALCESCAPIDSMQKHRTQTLAVTALGEYVHGYREAVRALKDGRRDVARELGRRLSACIAEGTTLVPVPTTAARRRVRGIDGVALLASVAAAASNAEIMCAVECVSRDRQRGRDRSARLLARDRFVCRSGLVDGMTLALVDDVCTTGTTLEDCAAALRRCGADVSQAFVIAVANRRA